MSILSPAARAAALAAADQVWQQRAREGIVASMAEHVKAVVDAALDAAEAAEHCPYPGCIVQHRDHPGRHVTAGPVISTPPPPPIWPLLPDPAVEPERRSQ